MKAQKGAVMAEYIDDGKIRRGREETQVRNAPCSLPVGWR